ncbi:PTS sugar transporter subunit IIA [Thermoanaerobacterium sp. DL9XJH110]|uniref:PTS sugar transporter subunit IIA n=1 Tax=Thermoanaerobacterium sp. DL9XJH110 TaxID=3386643 RepID=UPI003BB80903
MLDLDLIELNMEAETAGDVIKRLAGKMVSKGYVKESFPDAVLEREKNFPTGLPAEGVGVAIPHTDAAHVIRSCISIATLKKPVIFKMMGMPERPLEVCLVMLLAIADPDGQLQVLKQLMEIFQNKNTLLKLASAATPKQVAEIFASLNL